MKDLSLFDQDRDGDTYDRPPSLFDPDLSRQARQEAIKRVGTNAHEEFMDVALRAVGYTARRLFEFTTDDVVSLMQTFYPDVVTHDNRAWGPVMRAAAKDGLIINTGRVRESNMVSNHRRPKAIWRSLVRVPNYFDEKVWRP